MLYQLLLISLKWHASFRKLRTKSINYRMKDIYITWREHMFVFFKFQAKNSFQHIKTVYSSQIYIGILFTLKVTNNQSTIQHHGKLPEIKPKVSMLLGFWNFLFIHKLRDSCFYSILSFLKESDLLKLRLNISDRLLKICVHF